MAKHLAEMEFLLKYGSTEEIICSADCTNNSPMPGRGTLRPQIDDYGNVFNPSFQVFSGAAGSFQAVVNMGPVQPHQRNVRVSQHSRDKLDELQQTFNDLERKGVGETRRYRRHG
ncbi:hypothetical protein NP493_711g02030 [Ridgeia piscesae]|uniref:Uncharacterized protein n=1 Tax=Ridgeia piscesae TaxID=27915 RepID=A0AAD9KQL5_RIDPI|nr:hypothetical protein NP493_711g02030 [Ridgeia piscesae]